MFFLPFFARLNGLTRYFLELKWREKYMKTLYYDCFAGISGDMNLGALVDAGADAAELERRLETLGVGGWKLEISRESRLGIFGTRVHVALDSCECEGAEDFGHTHSEGCEHSHYDHNHSHDTHEHSRHAHEHAHNTHEHSAENLAYCTSNNGHSIKESGKIKTSAEARAHNNLDESAHGGAAAHRHSHRTFGEIAKIIENSGLSERVKRDSMKIFRALAEAEAKVHGVEIENVHFHEVGAVDSIVDIVGAAVCFELLGVDRIVSSAVELGSGTVRCAHGVMPVPAPATAELAKSFPSKVGGAAHEATTPTGAAIIASMCDAYEPKLSGKISSVGVGIGGRDVPGIANVLRVMVYETSQEPLTLTEEMALVEANIDDMSAEELAEFAQSLFGEGAVDAWQEPIAMKKCRVGVKVCALCPTGAEDRVAAAFFERSGTLGVRRMRVRRDSLPREETVFESSFGKVRVKTARFGGIRKSKAEADDIAKISAKTRMPFGKLSRKILDEFEGKGAE